MRNRRPLVLALLLIGACVTTPPAPVPPPSPGYDPPAPEACAAACEKLTELHCPEATPTRNGLSCRTICERVERGGYMSFRPKCIAGASSVETVRTCNVRCNVGGLW